MGHEREGEREANAMGDRARGGREEATGSLEF